jgi:Ca2+-binding RTX toxin-like protein
MSSTGSPPAVPAPATRRRVVLIALVLAFVLVARALWPASPPGGRIALAAGAVDISVDGSGGGGSIVFAPALCATMLAPGDPCTDTLVVRNAGGAGDFSLTYTITVWADANNTDNGAPGPAGDTIMSCFNVHLVQPAPADGLGVGNASTEGPLAGSFLILGATESWGLEVSVEDDNSCQGQTATIIVLVVATDAASPPVPAECVGATFDHVLIGTPGNDTITGLNGKNLIFGLGGDDILTGDNGKDCIVGGPGSDIIHGNNGPDILLGEDGNDTIFGDAGPDYIDGGPGTDACDAGSGGNPPVNCE